MTPADFLRHPPDSVVLYPAPVLRRAGETITDIEPWKQIAPIMFDLMYRFHGCGLAAPQVGLPYCMFVLDVTRPLVCLNPEIIKTNDRLWTENEGCLSLPGLRVPITRSRQIKIKYLNLDGEEEFATYEGWTGRAIQHETDHCFGKLIIDFMNEGQENQTKTDTGK